VAARSIATASPATAGLTGNAAGEFHPHSSPAGARPRHARGQAGAARAWRHTELQAAHGTPCAAQAHDEADGWY
jgi:hypothetical protein